MPADGRIDPGGATLRALRGTLEVKPTEGGAGPEPLQVDEHVVGALGRHARALVVELDEAAFGEGILHARAPETLEHGDSGSCLAPQCRG